MRLLFYAINGVGLGHVQRLLLIAEEVHALRPDAHILFLTNSAYPQMIESRGFPCIRVPLQTSPEASSHLAGQSVPLELHDRLFETLVDTFLPAVVVCDTHGPWGIRRIVGAAKTVLILRRGTDEHMLRSMQHYGGFTRICVPHSEEEFRSMASPAVTKALRKARAVFAGPVVRRSAQHIRKGTRILVLAGGGGWVHASDFLHAAGKGLAPLLKRKAVRADFVTGPLFKGHFVPPAGAEVHRYLDNTQLTELMGSCTLAVAQAGYNTCNELLASGLPSVLVPAPRELEDQWERALALERKGCALVAEASATGIHDTAERLLSDAALLEKMRRACMETLGESGTKRIAEEIVSLQPEVCAIRLGADIILRERIPVVVASGALSAGGIRALRKLRSQARCLILEVDPAVATSGQLRRASQQADALIVQMGEEDVRAAKGGNLSDRIAAALAALPSWKWVEIRIPADAGVFERMDVIARTLQQTACQQVLFHMVGQIPSAEMEHGLSRTRKVLLSGGSMFRVYCSPLAVNPTEFSFRRLADHARSALARERTGEQRELGVRHRLVRSLAAKPRVTRWLSLERGTSPQLRRVESALREMEGRYTRVPGRTSSACAELPKLLVAWRKSLRQVKMLETKINESRERHLGGIMQELDAVYLRQEELLAGKEETSLRSITRAREHLNLRYNVLWQQHLAAMDEEHARERAVERNLASQLYPLLRLSRHRLMAEKARLAKTIEVQRLLQTKKEIMALEKSTGRTSRCLLELERRADWT